MYPLDGFPRSTWVARTPAVSAGVVPAASAGVAPPAGGQQTLYPEPPTIVDIPMCRICFETENTESDPLIAPCLCAGGQKFVHRSCLEEWRAQELVPHAFTHCPTCKFQYRTELVEANSTVQRVKLVLFVSRDTIALFVVVQLVIMAGASIIKAVDTAGVVKTLYPHRWAEINSASKLAIGPYYVTSALGFFALLGFGGLLLFCRNRSRGEQPDSSRHRPRWRRPRNGVCDHCCVRCEDRYCLSPYYGERSDCPAAGTAIATARPPIATATATRAARSSSSSASPSSSSLC